MTGLHTCDHIIVICSREHCVRWIKDHKIERRHNKSFKRFQLHQKFHTVLTGFQFQWKRVRCMVDLTFDVRNYARFDCCHFLVLDTKIGLNSSSLCITSVANFLLLRRFVHAIPFLCLAKKEFLNLMICELFFGLRSSRCG